MQAPLECDSSFTRMRDLIKQSLLKHISKLYPEDSEIICERVLALIERHYPLSLNESAELWSERDVLLITYGDSVIEPDRKPLETLQRFLEEHVRDAVSGVHILPFFPYSSDDGFSVIDYRAVNKELGDWEHITNIAADFKLMVDLVINHVSRESLWFSDYINNCEPACNYFLDMDPDTDLSKVTRPRNTPLLASVHTHRGMRYVWATFSEDQIDLNFGNPVVLLEFVEILLFYIKAGARLIRLDAVAFLWKEVGTTCIHLKQTHQVVKLLREILNFIAPDCILLTETNVPHAENVSYFGDGDEAHMVYQFSLPPLLLHALNRGTSMYLRNWASVLSPLPKHCTYFNFTASHDGIGLRALEGILAKRDVDDLIECMNRFGGFVSMKANPNGEDTPYEINISLFDALQGTRRGTDQWQVNRFICSQAVMLALQGIPAIYIHSLVATPNDIRGVEITGRTRSINRRKWQYDELVTALEDPHTPNREVFQALLKLLKIRRSESCFHPDNPQEIIDAGNSLFAVLRTNTRTGTRLLAIHNVTASPQTIPIQRRPELTDEPMWLDLVSGEVLPDILPCISLRPYQVLWLLEQDKQSN